MANYDAMLPSEAKRALTAALYQKIHDSGTFPYSGNVKFDLVAAMRWASEIGSDYVNREVVDCYRNALTSFGRDFPVIDLARGRAVRRGYEK